jgi:putative transposase
VSPSTVRRYLPSGSGSGTRRISQCWTTFVGNHARAVLACDFLVAVTVRFRLLYVFVVLDVGTRRSGSRLSNVERKLSSVSIAQEETR